MIAQFETTGFWLFRYRSFVPLCAAPLLAVGLFSYEWLQGSQFKSELWALACLVISLSGLAVRIVTVGFVPKRTSGRNTHEQVAASLNTTGIYSVMRHPLYVGNYLSILGFALFFRSPWIVIVLTCLFALYYERIMFAEERFLTDRFGEQFERWAAVTPAIFPRRRGWVPAANRFCLRTTLRREYTGVLLVIAGFAILDTIADSIVEKRWHLQPLWTGFFIGAVVIYLVLRTLKKQTRLLHVKGR
jgi:protein-S-isoprenylcysteine O-methyltransferase Ste14